MKRILAGIIALVFLTLFVVSQNKQWMEHIADWRFSNINWAPDKYKHGDLYGICFLQQYKENFDNTAYTKYPKDTVPNHLYIVHDSYLQKKLDQANFVNIGQLNQLDYRNGQSICIDTSVNNILIIETAERFARWRLGSTGYFINIVKISKKENKTVKEAKSDKPSSIVDTLSTWKHFTEKAFNPNIDKNLEFNLFDYTIISPLRGLKTLINYTLFDKINNDILISKNNKYLLLKETVDTSRNTSSFHKLEDEELTNIAKSMNALQDHYLGKGFKKVIFSIIPNTATIIDSTRCTYNKMLIRLPLHQTLIVNYIDMYPLFKRQPDNIYQHGDSHWNHHGKQLWIDEVNKRLRTIK